MGQKPSGGTRAPPREIDTLPLNDLRPRPPPERPNVRPPRRALDRCPPGSALYYDQVAQVVVTEWNRGRVALVGDACQAVSLLAGQGTSFAVAGAYVLGEQLATADSIDTELASYEQV